MLTPHRLRVAATLAVLAAGALTFAAPGSAATGDVVINEVESSGGIPDDWIELTNTATTTADVSGYVLRDNDDSPTKQVVLPAGTTIAAGGFLAVDTQPAFGLGGNDGARLYAADGTTLLDAYAWTSHAVTTYGRCPDGTGAWVTTAAPTRGAANDCSGTTPPPTVRTDTVPWPGGAGVATVDAADQLGEDISGLAWEAGDPPVLWAVKNDPGVLYRLLWDGTTWTPDASNGWANGKQLRYPDGTGTPDTEGVTLVAGSSANGVVVATERDGDDDGVSKPALLRFDVSGTGTELVATREYDMTGEVPATTANTGFEAVTWFPDSALVAGGLVDQNTRRAYDPATYPAHGDGLFLAGLEANGVVYAYALDETADRHTLIASFSSGFRAVMDLTTEDTPNGPRLWAWCDNTCTNQATVLAPANRTYAVDAAYAKPAGLPDVNNEGLAFAPNSLCVDGRKPVVWADDDNDGGHALRQGTLDCTTAGPAPTTPPVSSAGGGGGGAVPQGNGAPPLAETGAQTGVTLPLGLALVGVGAALSWVARSRRSGAHRA